MANYQSLKAAINAVIRANGNKEITGTVLNETLTAMVNSLGANYQFAGVATPSTNPGTPDQNVFYLAGQAGTYTNFNNTVLPNGVSVLKWNGSWSSETVVVYDGVFDISAYKATGGTLATFADLSAALDGGNNIPSALRKGGMSVKFVQSSDNKYVQFRYMSSSTAIADFTNVANWQGVDEELTAGSRNLVEGGAVWKNLYPVKNTIVWNSSQGGNVSNKIYNGLKRGETVIIDIIVGTVKANYFRLDNRGLYISDAIVIASGALTSDRHIEYTATEDMNLWIWTAAQNITASGELNINIYLKGSVSDKINTLNNDVNSEIQRAQSAEQNLSQSIIDLSGVVNRETITIEQKESGKFKTVIIPNASVGDHYKLVINTKQTNNSISVTYLAVSTGEETSGSKFYGGSNISPNNIYDFDINVLVDGDINIWTINGNIISAGTIEYTVIDCNSKYNLVNRVDELDERFEKETISVDIIPPAIYTVCNDNTNNLSNRSYSLKMQIDHFFRKWNKRHDINVEGGKNFFPFYSKLNSYGNYINSSTSNTTKDIDSKTKSIKIVGLHINDLIVPVLHRSIRNKATLNKKVRLLCIGDSVTLGTGSFNNMPYNSAPRRYWEWVTALFEMDKIENGNSGYDFITLGNVLNNSIDKTSFDINFGDLQKQGVTACACGVGGSRTSDWVSSEIHGDVTVTNPFYDIVNNKFSVNYWVNKYRTLLVEQDGSLTRCDASNKGSLAPNETTKNNVCEPTHILIQLGYNQLYNSEGTKRTNYLTQLQTMINTIRTEYPSVFILLSLPDTPGTYFPQLYPDYFGDGDDIYSLDYMAGSAKTTHDSISFMNTDLISLVDEANNIFYCPTYFSTPGCICSSHRVSDEVGYLSSHDIRERYNVHYGSLPQLHPNNVAHANWAYQIYSLIKYTLLL